MDHKRIQSYVDQRWDDSIVPELCDYVRIPNKSPLFDPDWEAHGYMDQAVELMERWCRAQDVPGMTVEVVRLPGRTPVLFLEVPGTGSETVLLYGHLDKQPEFTGWEEELSPWEPVIRDGKLYGRGGADDGYAVFGSLTAIQALQQQGIPHARCVILIEACEESGSFDLPYYFDELADRIGTPSLVVCLDAECGNYDQLWCTTSLRGNLVGTLRADVLREGVHSGGGSGIVSCSPGSRTPAPARSCRRPCMPTSRRRGSNRPTPRPPPWATRSIASSPGRARPARSPRTRRSCCSTTPGARPCA
jgi:acetylornithine deacetylase/succinyl-diaminopimelate desuccinylase-like protein